MLKRKYKRAKDTINSVLSDAGVEIRKAGQEDTPERRRKIVEDFKRGMSVQAVARKHQASKRTVMNFLKEAGVSQRDPDVSVRNTRRSSLDESQIIADYKAGESIYGLTKKYKTSQRRILDILRNQKVGPNKETLVISMARDRRSLTDVATRTGFNVDQINAILDNNNLPELAYSKAPRKPRKSSPKKPKSKPNKIVETGKIPKPTKKPAPDLSGVDTGENDTIKNEIVNLVNSNPSVLTPRARQLMVFYSNHSPEETAAKFELTVGEVEYNVQIMLDALKKQQAIKDRKVRALKSRAT